MKKISSHRPRASSPPSFFERYYAVFLTILVVLAALVYVVRNPQYRTGSFNDDAMYVIGARDFWHGEANRSPLLRPDYPFPGLALVLSPLARVVEPHWIRLEWLSVLCTLFLVVIAARWSRIWLSPAESLAYVTLLAFNPILARLSGALMASNYFALALVGSFYLLTLWLKHPTRRYALALGLLSGWGALVRPEGFLLPLVIAVALAMSRRRWSHYAAYAAGLLPWALFAGYWFFLRAFSHLEYQSDLQALWFFWINDPWGGLGFARTLGREFLNFALLFVSADSVNPTIDLLLLVAILGLLVQGLRQCWKGDRQWRPVVIAMTLFAALYFAIHLYWHAVVPRYAIALLPLTLLLWVGGSRILEVQSHWLRLLRPLGLGCLLIVYGARHFRAAREAAMGSNPMNVPPWHTLDWLSQNAPAKGTIMSNIAPSIDLYTGHRSINGVFTPNYEWQLYRLLTEKMPIIVIRNGLFVAPGVGQTQDPNKIWVRFHFWAKHDPGRLPLVYSHPTEQTWVYRVQTGPRFVTAYDYFRQAVALYRQDQSDPGGLAFRLFQKSVATDDTLGSAYNFLGALYLHKKDLPNAERCFLRATALVPDPAFHLNLASLYAMTGRADAAAKAVQSAFLLAEEMGESSEWNQKAQQLSDDWKNHRLRLLLDAP